MEIETMNRRLPPLLQRQGHTRTIKFWIAPDGRTIPLKGLWHYQWALKHADREEIDLKGHTTENPVRLRMLAEGWWRVNYDCKAGSLTIEGDRSGGNQVVVDAIISLTAANHQIISRVNLAVLDGESVNHRVSLRNPFEPGDGSALLKELRRHMALTKVP